jgi:large-conductance mechanosensitive channel
MAEKITTGSIIQSSLITAFILAAALIWKDVISDFITQLVPARQELYYEFLAAILATIIVVIAIFAVIKTESEAESIVKRMKKKRPHS